MKKEETTQTHTPTHKKIHPNDIPRSKTEIYCSTIMLLLLLVYRYACHDFRGDCITYYMRGKNTDFLRRE